MTCLSDVFEGRARYHVALCDCRFGLASLPAESVDAIVCDPPYGIGFMGRKWDTFAPEETARRREQKRRKNTDVPDGPHGKPGELSGAGIEYDRSASGNRRFQEWCADWAREVLRVAKPGAHLVVFGGTRTWHRMAAGVEDAGWEIRDCLCWLFGSGFPKSLNVSKEIDKRLGAEREPDEYTGPNGKNAVYGSNMGGGHTLKRSDPCTAAAAAAAAGFGTALKPAFEPVILARKPLCGTVAENFMRHGTGALNIDGCRIDWVSEEDKAAAAAAAQRSCLDQNAGRTAYADFNNGPASLAPYLAKMDAGRWPANVILDEESAELLDAQSGDRPGMSGGGVHRADYAGGMFGTIDCAANARGDNGGASRFFYTAKAPRNERDAGLEEFALASGAERTERTERTERKEGSAGITARAGATGSARNTHPTVKPVDLMRWLVRLVTPTGGLVLDPFCGSGSTGVAAMLEGFRFVGMELDPLHVDFARARIAHKVGGTWEREVPDRRVEPVQPSLFASLDVQGVP